MNKEWSNMNKTFQDQIKKESSFDDGIKNLLELRKTLMDIILSFFELERNSLDVMPFLNKQGYESKNIAYSIYHIFRIEDIVCNVLLKEKNTDIFLKNDYQNKMNAIIITTGNELQKEEIKKFTSNLDIDILKDYILNVYGYTNYFLSNLSFSNLSRKMNENDRERLVNLNIVSKDENAYFLVDYWCSKNVRGLIQMPFSRHWIMHVEAMLRILDKLS